MDDRTPEFGKPADQGLDGGASSGGGGSSVGCWISGIGCLIAISPIPATYIYCGLRGNPGGCGDMAMLIFGTVPFGGFIMVIGLIAALVGGRNKGDGPSEGSADGNGHIPPDRRPEFPNYTEGDK